MGATSLPFGVVNAPGQRYHPAIVAQAAATLCEMFPGRLWVARGIGEASNEHITGGPWPDKETRTARLHECVEVMRRLFAGETVSHDGLVRVDRAKLHTLPAEPPPLVGQAISVETARSAGEWADGLATVNQPHDKLREMIAAFRENGGEGKRLVLPPSPTAAERCLCRTRPPGRAMGPAGRVPHLKTPSRNPSRRPCASADAGRTASPRSMQTASARAKMDITTPHTQFGCGR